MVNKLKSNKSKAKRKRRKQRKQNKVKSRQLKVIGANAAGLLCKLESFEKLFHDEEHSMFCIQDPK
jgi:hypothetical protein